MLDPAPFGPPWQPINPIADVMAIPTNTQVGLKFTALSLDEGICAWSPVRRRKWPGVDESGFWKVRMIANSRRLGNLAWTGIINLLSLGCCSTPETGPRSLFDGQSLAGWRRADFIGGVEPQVQQGSLILPAGDTLSGAVWTRDLPVGDYEITLEAMRVEGHDIFCGLTFPVADSHVSLVLGGWGGSLCGISSLDGMDASENETMSTMNFENGKWYTVRVRVSDGLIEAWVGDEGGEKLILDVETEGRRLDTRYEMRHAKPLGLATWRTRAAIRNINWRSVPPG